MVENECIKACCQASCCKDIFFLIPMTDKQILAAFPQAVKVKGYVYLSNNLPEGIYYAHGYIRIVGVCPNLSDDFNCNLYYNPARPNSCLRAGRYGNACVESRRRDSVKV